MDKRRALTALMLAQAAAEISSVRHAPELEPRYLFPRPAPVRYYLTRLGRHPLVTTQPFPGYHAGPFSSLADAWDAAPRLPPLPSPEPPVYSNRAQTERLTRQGERIGSGRSARRTARRRLEGEAISVSRQWRGAMHALRLGLPGSLADVIARWRSAGVLS